MCAKCVEAVRKIFPEYANDDSFINFILWEKTPFPFGNAESVLKQTIATRGTLFVDGEGI